MRHHEDRSTDYRLTAAWRTGAYVGWVSGQSTSDVDSTQEFEITMNRLSSFAVSSGVSIVLGVAAGGCGSDESKPAADLPAGWQSAQAIEDLHQTACEGSPYDGTKEAMAASANGRSVSVDYEPAHFRCAQTVQAYAKTAAGTIDLLVQPIDMNPTSVAKCDCLYGVHMNVPVSTGTYSVTVYRRWDHKSGADDPLKIGSSMVQIP